jgi:hypothetical protein
LKLFRRNALPIFLQKKKVISNKQHHEINSFLGELKSKSKIQLNLSSSFGVYKKKSITQSLNYLEFFVHVVFIIKFIPFIALLILLLFFLSLLQITSLVFIIVSRQSQKTVYEKKKIYLKEFIWYFILRQKLLCLSSYQPQIRNFLRNLIKFKINQCLGVKLQIL